MTKRINGEIWGHGTPIIRDGKIYVACGGEEVGGARAKRDAKALARRLRRREDRYIERDARNA